MAMSKILETAVIFLNIFVKCQKYEEILWITNTDSKC